MNNYVQKLAADATHAFCESEYAQAISPWHIRPLTDKGPRFGGAAYTKALCGRAVSWDLDVKITEHHLTHCCKACAGIYNNGISNPSSVDK